MIVLVAGMYRSGSTFSFNVVRELLAARGGVLGHAVDSLGPALFSPDHAHLILKSHAPDEFCTELVRLGAIRCVCTYRKPEDSIASWMRAFDFGLDDSIHRLRSWLVWHQRMAPYCLNVEYEQLDSRPFLAVLRVQHWLLGRYAPIAAWRLRCRYDKRRLKHEYDELENSGDVSDIGFSYYDRETFFHRRHISSVRSAVAGDLLTKPDVQRIRDELASYVDADGRYRPAGDKPKSDDGSPVAHGGASIG